MNSKFLNFGIMRTVAFFSIAVLLFACSSNESKDNIEEAIDEEVQMDEDLVKDFNKAKQVFYSLPSPIETAMLMKRAGAKYNQDLLNPIDKVSNYHTNKSMALNLGVYSADLSFASMFDQSQISIKYLTVSKKLAEELGILNAIDKSILDRMESNVNNRDSLMEIITETFMNSNSFLKENDRPATAAIILVGGWVEGLYIATQTAKVTKQNKEMIERIVDQRLSLQTLLSLLEQHAEGNEDVNSLLIELKKIKEVFDKIKVTTSKIEPQTDKQTKQTILKSSTETSVSNEVFNELLTKVAELRNNIVK